MSSSPEKKGGFRWDDVRIFYDDLNTMMMEIMMMTKYDDDERVGKRIRGRRNWPDSGAAGEADRFLFFFCDFVVRSVFELVDPACMAFEPGKDTEFRTFWNGAWLFGYQKY